MKRNKRTQTYNDGLLSVYSTENTAPAGEMPNDTPVLKIGGLRYENRTVGMTRFWQGKQQDTQIDRLVRCPKISSVHNLDVAVTEDGDQYDIVQVQYPEDVELPSMDLSLELIKAKAELDPPDEGGEEP